MIAAVADTRKERNRQQLPVLAGWAAGVLAGPALVVTVVVGVASGVVWGVAAGIALYLAAVILAYWQVRGYGSAVVASQPETTLGDHERARLENLVDGLCVAHGVTRPAVRVMDLDSFNAATVVLGVRGPQVVLLITAELARNLSRIELEGVLAQQLSRVRDGDATVSTIVAALSSLPVIGALLGRRAASCLDQHLETAADLAGAAMTRYPPGLAAALGRLRDHPNEIPGVPGTAAHLWIADPLPPGRAEPYVLHPPLADRIEVLSEL